MELAQVENITENKAQKGMKTFVLVAISGVGVFLTVSAIQYGYKVWTRARQPEEETITPAEETAAPTPTPTTTTAAPGESLFEPLVGGEEETSTILNYSEFVDAYGTDDPTYDFNGDGTVDDEDFEIFKERYQAANP